MTPTSALLILPNATLMVIPNTFALLNGAGQIKPGMKPVVVAMMQGTMNVGLLNFLKAGTVNSPGYLINT